jgi:hypothetical protein
MNHRKNVTQGLKILPENPIPISVPQGRVSTDTRPCGTEVLRLGELAADVAHFCSARDHRSR